MIDGEGEASLVLYAWGYYANSICNAFLSAKYIQGFWDKTAKSCFWIGEPRHRRNAGLFRGVGGRG